MINKNKDFLPDCKDHGRVRGRGHGHGLHDRQGLPGFRGRLG